MDRDLKNIIDETLQEYFGSDPSSIGIESGEKKYCKQEPGGTMAAVNTNEAAYRIYNRTLCPDIWDAQQHLYPEVRATLLQLADDFYKKTKLIAPVLDVYLMGSIANYNWTPESDADVHIIIDFNQLKMPGETAAKVSKAAGAMWNGEHNITVKGHKVEINIQSVNAEKPHVTGIYSLTNDKWIRQPQHQSVQVDKPLIQSKFLAMKKYIEFTIQSGDREAMKAAKDYLDDYRQYGLDNAGELSTENIVYKVLRAKGLIKKLKDSIVSVYDNTMTITQEAFGDSMPFDYIGGINQGEVRGERIPLGRCRYYIHSDFPGLYSGQNSTNWRYDGYKNRIVWNTEPEPSDKPKVDDFLAKRGIKNATHVAMYRNMGESKADDDRYFAVGQFESLTEVSQKDINAKFPLPQAMYKGNEKPELMTLGNLKSIRDKAKRTLDDLAYRYREDPSIIQHWQDRYKAYDDEIKDRLAYINAPVMEEVDGDYSESQDEFDLGHQSPRFDVGSLSHDIDRVSETNQNEFDMGQKHQTWNLLPSKELVLLWATFAKYGRVDEKRLLKLFSMLSELVIKISLNTDVWRGHNAGFFYKDGFEEISDEENERFAWFISDRSGNNWIRNTGERGGNARYSDQSDRLYKLLEKCYNSDTPEELLINMDLILNFVHGMGNMAKWFVEGGADTLDKIRDLQIKGIHLIGKLSEMATMSKQGKEAYANDTSLKNAKVEDVKGNMVMFRVPTDGIFAEGYTLVYFMDSDESAKAIAEGKIPYLMIPRGSFHSGGNPITDVWKKKYQQPGTEHILGLLEGNSKDELIFLDMLSVRPGWRRNSIAKKMLELVKERFPKAKITTSSRTEDGSKFLKSQSINECGVGAGKPEEDRLHISGHRWQIKSKDAPKTPKMKEHMAAPGEVPYQPQQPRQDFFKPSPMADIAPEAKQIIKDAEKILDKKFARGIKFLTVDQMQELVFDLFSQYLPQLSYKDPLYKKLSTSIISLLSLDYDIRNGNKRIGEHITKADIRIIDKIVNQTVSGML